MTGEEISMRIKHGGERGFQKGGSDDKGSVVFNRNEGKIFRHDITR